MSLNVVNAFHIFFVGPFLIYIGIKKPQIFWIYVLLLILGICLFFKFLYELCMKKVSQSTIWYLIHMLLFSTLMIFMGINNITSPKICYSLLLAIGISAFGYHLTRALGL